MNPAEIQLTYEYLSKQRDAYLALVDSIERLLEISPRTAELRRQEKRERVIIPVVMKDEVKE